MGQSGIRTARIEARISPDALDLVRRAAEIEGRSVSDFVTAAAQEAAKRTIADMHVIQVSLADQQALAAAIADPPEPSPALARALARHRTLIRESR
ncbi:MAG: hypothetical protein RLY86_3174 [Pseudomonadota bacterium]|jgi:uncharacterized protein (DUF1778 family)